MYALYCPPHTHTHTHMYICMHAHTCTYACTHTHTHRCILTYEVAVANHPDGPYKTVNTKHLLFPLFVYWEKGLCACGRDTRAAAIDHVTTVLAWCML